jgi:hypothetical protein
MVKAMKALLFFGVIIALFMLAVPVAAVSIEQPVKDCGQEVSFKIDQIGETEPSAGLSYTGSVDVVDETGTYTLQYEILYDAKEREPRTFNWWFDDETVHYTGIVTVKGGPSSSSHSYTDATGDDGLMAPFNSKQGIKHYAISNVVFCGQISVEEENSNPKPPEYWINHLDA